MKNQDQRHWHQLQTEEVVQLLDVNLQTGLAGGEVKARQEKYGPNKLTAARRTSALKRFVLQFAQPLMYILLIASGVTLFLGEYVDSAVIFAVTFVNAFVGFLQESKAEKAIDALSQMVLTEATVRRDGQKRRVNSVELVPGDVVLLQSGDKVPADVRLFHVRSLQVDESALTGESVPVEKHAKRLPLDTVLADRRNLGFAGTLVTYGQAESVVWAIGNQTETGRIARLIHEAADLTTPLTRKIAQFSKLVLWVILGLAALTFAIGVARGEKAVEMFMAAVALAVGAIPEGLPAAVTITLAIGVSRMAKRRAIIRKLPAVEALGSTTVICSDKTGTLTENQMTVQQVYAGGNFYDVTGSGYEPLGEVLLSGRRVHVEVPGLSHASVGSVPLTPALSPGEREKPSPPVEQSSASSHGQTRGAILPLPGGEGRGEGEGAASKTEDSLALRETLLAGLLNNDSQLVRDGDRLKVEGDPTEAALIVAAQKAGLVPADTHSAHPRLDVIPFESEHQFMATLHSRADGEARVIYKKGSVERLLERCAHSLGEDGELAPLDADAVRAAVDQMAAKGLRVLAFARREVAHDHHELHHDHVKEGLTFLGFQGMIDPPRAEAITSVRKCQEAGIQVKMITGDHALTARSIAQQLGLKGGERINSPPGLGLRESSGALEADVGHQSGDASAGAAEVCRSQRRSRGVGETGQGELIAVTGRELEKVSDADLPALAERAAVFARVAPEQKLKLVRALQSRGHIVAMTGDGVNDAPALKQADIGVAMGITGTDVAKGAADMLLTDDNFASIEAAVEEGRCVFDNLTKFIIWTLPTNAGEGLILLTAIFLGTALPALPVQLLWINMVTAILLGLMLVFEPKERSLMQRPPRDPRQPIITFPLFMRTGLVTLLMLAGAFGAFLWEQQVRGKNVVEARTTVINVIVMVECFYLLNCRSLLHSMFAVGLWTNLSVFAGIAAMLGAQLAFTHAPVMNRLFHTAPLDAASWLYITGVGLAAYCVVEFEKWMRRKFGREERVLPAS